MAITFASYNDILFINVQILQIDQHVEYDHSGTDQLFVRTELSFSGYVFTEGSALKDLTRPHAEALSYKTNRDNWLSPRAIVSQLSLPRKTCRLWQKMQDGREYNLWLVRPATEEPTSFSTDCDGGPKPKSVKITHAFPWGYQVEVSIQFALQDRDKKGRYDPQQKGDWALSNRWSLTEQYDENFFCTRSYRGVIRLANAIAADQVQARYLAFPQLEPGFRRESAEYTVSESGLEVVYQIVDRQAQHAPPWPCTKWEVRHTESLVKQGYRVQSTCQVHLWGPPGLPKAYLLARLAQILKARLRWDLSMGTAGFLESLRVVDEIQEPSVYGEITLNRFPVDSEEDKLKKQYDWFGRLTRDILGQPLQLPPLKQDPKLAIYGKEPTQQEAPYTHIRPHPLGYSVFGTERTPAEIVFFACYYQVPEHPPHCFHPGETEPVESIPESTEVKEGSTTYPTPKPVDVLPDEPIENQLSASHAQALYTFATMQQEYDQYQGKVAVPLAFLPSSSPGEYGKKDQIVVTTLHLPILRRRLRYEAERIGQWPEIPTPVDYDLQDGGQAHLIRYQVRPQPPTLAADGVNLIYRVEAHYEWAFTQQTNQLDVGILPYIRADAVLPFSLEATKKSELTWNILPKNIAPEQGIA